MKLPVRSFIRNPFDRNPVSGIAWTRMPGSSFDQLNPIRLRRLHLRWAMAAALAFAVAATPLFAGGFSLAQKHENRHEIDQLEDTWRNAVLNSDTKAMDSLLADDYMAITAAGTLQSRDETLANLRSGRLRFTTLTITDRKVRFYGTTAVVTSLATIEATNPDGPVTGDYRYTHVYVRDAQGAWKIVSFEASHVREPGPHKRNELH
jgi:ketosteroid isomerase-like protein